MLDAIDKTDFTFPGQTSFYRGKVRDVYGLPDSLLFVATDRYSAFDRNLTLIPRKGELVTAISRWWFDQTAGIIKNHVTGYPDPNVTWGKKYKVIPIEMVVRGYMTGVTATSLWHTYSEGQRDYGNFTLPDGLRKNYELPEPVLTPTTKFEKHDRPLTPDEAVKEGLIEAKTWDKLRDVALKLFSFGQKAAAERGLILVDTKYEFGMDEQGAIVLIDEIHTPDSSRYWRADSYQASLAADQEPDNYDKEYLRLWYQQHFNPYEAEVLPQPPVATINELTKRYVYVYEQLTGQKFKPAASKDVLGRIEANIRQALLQGGSS